MKKRCLKKDKLVIGVTGGMGSGKSTVARFLAGRSGTVIDADRIGHELLQPGSPVYKKLVRFFGPDILNVKGEIDRKVLGRIVFSDRRRLAELNRLMHPGIVAGIRAGVANAAGKLVVVDAPLLFETGLDKDMDIVITVRAGFDKRAARLCKRSGFSCAEIARRMEHQMPLREKAARADYVIDNSGDMIKTKKKVMELRRNLWRS
jgi:dephospho-CoA kinase